MADLEDIIERLDAIRNGVNSLSTNDERANLVDQLKGVVRDLQDLPEAKGRSIEQFFTAVGEGARTAQQQLDEQSALYMQQRPDFAPDTMFRIPKVTANLKLAMTEISGEKVGFVVFKKTKSSERLLEQEISFDIVAAPPPPEALAVLADLPLGQVVASSEAQRRAAFEALDRTRTGLQQGGGQNPNPQLANAIQIMTARDDASAEFSDSFRHVLVMPQEEYFVLIYVLPEDRRDEKFPEKGGSIILVPRDPAKGPEPTSFGINPDIADNKIRFAFRILAPLADRQAELLAHLERQ